MQATLNAGPFAFRKQQDRSLLMITCVVVFVHLAFIIWAALAPPQTIVPFKPAERLIVKTIDLKPTKPQPAVRQALPLNPEPIVEAAPEPAVVEELVSEPEIELIPVPTPLEERPKPSPKPIEVKKPEPVKETPKPKPEVKKPTSKPAKKEVTKKPEPKKEVKKEKPKEKKLVKDPFSPPAPKKTAEKPKVDAKAQQAQAKQRELLAQAQQSIAKIDKGRGKIASSKSSDLLTATTLPGRIDSLQIDALPDAEPLTAREIGYRDELASRLKLLLKLPEHGEVKVKLTLERSGKVAKLIIVNSQSVVNRSYIEKKVPGLSFPAFGDNFEGESQYTFIIALSNEF